MAIALAGAKFVEKSGTATYVASGATAPYTYTIPTVGATAAIGVTSGIMTAGAVDETVTVHVVDSTAVTPEEIDLVVYVGYKSVNAIQLTAGIALDMANGWVAAKKARLEAICVLRGLETFSSLGAAHPNQRLQSRHKEAFMEVL